MSAIQDLEEMQKHYPKAKYYLNFSSPLELMVAAILSARIRDTVVNETTPKLFKKYKTAKDYANANINELIDEISDVTFPGNKAKWIISACSILVKKHKGEVPKTIEELVELPGIGKKTANAIQQNAFDIVNGIVVDTHVLRVSYRLGWTKNRDPEKVEEDLMKLFPKKYWKKIPHYMKDHGRAVCMAPVPKCSKCFLNKSCPKKGVTKKL
jgi:endonuclease-3